MRIGRYEVASQIGEGGAAVVFHARGPDGREVALKLLKRGDPATTAKFEREKRLLAELGEPEGFVALLDSGMEGDRPFVVMPFVAGGTLRARLEAGALPVAESVALVRTLAAALGRAHERGIVHRDLKPENILFTASGQPLVADLGLAKHFTKEDAAPGAVSFSRTGELRGTAGYMAPEQMADAKNVGPAADVFALGAVLYECLAGHAAFEGDTVYELVGSVVAGKRRPLGREVPAPLARVVDRALAVDPSGRFSDAGELARALGALERARSRRGPLALVAAGVAVLLGAGVLVVARLPRRPAAPLRPDVAAAATPTPGPTPAPLSAVARE
ncbi:MAG: serine/threonine-protein kinase, partial [Planctomycetota bacterium]